MNAGMVDQSGFIIGTTCINSKRSLSSAQRHASGIQLWSSPSIPDKSFVGGPILVKCCLKVASVACVSKFLRSSGKARAHSRLKAREVEASRRLAVKKSLINLTKTNALKLKRSLLFSRKEISHLRLGIKKSISVLNAINKETQKLTENISRYMVDVDHLFITT